MEGLPSKLAEDVARHDITVDGGRREYALQAVGRAAD